MSGILECDVLLYVTVLMEPDVMWKLADVTDFVRQDLQEKSRFSCLSADW